MDKNDGVGGNLCSFGVFTEQYTQNLMLLSELADTYPGGLQEVSELVGCAEMVGGQRRFIEENTARGIGITAIRNPLIPLKQIETEVRTRTEIIAQGLADFGGKKLLEMMRSITSEYQAKQAIKLLGILGVDAGEDGFIAVERDEARARALYLVGKVMNGTYRDFVRLNPAIALLVDSEAAIEVGIKDEF